MIAVYGHRSVNLMAHILDNRKCKKGYIQVLNFQCILSKIMCYQKDKIRL